jgi:hypothetical protein
MGRQGFGPQYAREIANCFCTQYNGRRKLELLAPDTYSLVHYREAERVAEDYRRIASRAGDLHAKLHAAARDAFYQLVLFPASVRSGE